MEGGYAAVLYSSCRCTIGPIRPSADMINSVRFPLSYWMIWACAHVVGPFVVSLIEIRADTSDVNTFDDLRRVRVSAARFRPEATVRPADTEISVKPTLAKLPCGRSLGAAGIRRSRTFSSIPRRGG